MSTYARSSETPPSTVLRTSFVVMFAVLASGTVLAATNEVTVDKGPDTPEANKAFMGGGVILQGQPGAPAPKPQALPEPPPTTPPAK